MILTKQKHCLICKDIIHLQLEKELTFYYTIEKFMIFCKLRRNIITCKHVIVVKHVSTMIAIQFFDIKLNKYQIISISNNSKVSKVLRLLFIKKISISGIYSFTLNFQLERIVSNQFPTE